MIETGRTARTAKIAIVGAGHVGVTLAYACMIRGTAKSIALFGRNAEKVRSEVLDLQHGLQFVPMATVTGSDDAAVCEGADVLVMTVGGPARQGQTRLDMAMESVAICGKVLPPLLEVAPGAVVLVVTNPVDVVTYAVQQIFGLPRNQVLGTGTVLDSSRLRALIARHCGVAVQSVHAYVAGEHGDSEIPLWSSATVGAVPVLPMLTAAERDDISRQVAHAGYDVLRGKGYTNYAVALAAARIIEAIVYDEHQVMPVSSLMTGYAGISDVCMSVPSVVNRTGVLRALPVPLSADERKGLHRSAAAVRATIDKLGSDALRNASSAPRLGI
jgi:L-lactate dehydrogenase